LLPIFARFVSYTTQAFALHRVGRSTVETDNMKRQTMPVTVPSKDTPLETQKLDRQYGKIGISAVAAAMRYQRDSDEYATPQPAPRPGAWKKGAAA
jgi:hypothetical protein